MKFVSVAWLGFHACCDQIACFISVALADDYMYPSAMPRILLLCAFPFIISSSTSTPPGCHSRQGKAEMRAQKEPSELPVGKQRVRARASLLPSAELCPATFRPGLTPAAFHPGLRASLARARMALRSTDGGAFD